MNWKKAFLVLVVLILGFAVLVSAAIGLAVATGVAATAGVVDTVVETAADVAEDAERLEIEVDVPRITVTDPDSGRSRVIAPRPEGRLRMNWSDDMEWSVRRDFWPAFALAPLALLFRGLFNLLAIGLIVYGVWLVVKKRQPAEKKADTA